MFKSSIMFICLAQRQWKVRKFYSLFANTIYCPCWQGSVVSKIYVNQLNFLPLPTTVFILYCQRKTVPPSVPFKNAPQPLFHNGSCPLFLLLVTLEKSGNQYHIPCSIVTLPKVFSPLSSWFPSPTPLPCPSLTLSVCPSPTRLRLVNSDGGAFCMFLPRCSTSSFTWAGVKLLFSALLKKLSKLLTTFLSALGLNPCSAAKSEIWDMNLAPSFGETRNENTISTSWQNGFSSNLLSDLISVYICSSGGTFVK